MTSSINKYTQTTKVALETTIVVPQTTIAAFETTIVVLQTTKAAFETTKAATQTTKAHPKTYFDHFSPIKNPSTIHTKDSVNYTKESDYLKSLCKRGKCIDVSS